jgi:hypothetical protein
MSTRTQVDTLRTLDLPDVFEDLSGVIGSDLRVIVNALTQRARERLMLSPRQARRLQCELWNRLTDAVSETMDPLSVERQ